MHSRWYIAELVVRFDIEGDEEWFFHVNAILVSAASTEEAFRKSEAIGLSSNAEYKNTDSKLVRSQFLGFRELFDVGDSLEDGSELYYEELRLSRGSSLDRLVRAKIELAAFKGQSDEVGV